MPVFHFPAKEEREQLIRRMRELAAQGQGQGPLYQDYAAAIEAMDAKMSALSAAAGDGLPPALTQEDAEQLQELIVTAATAGERFLAGEGVGADQEPQAPPAPGGEQPAEHAFPGLQGPERIRSEAPEVPAGAAGGRPGPHHRSAGPEPGHHRKEDLRVISASTAEKIRNMTPDMLRFSLRGSGLPESELKLAVQRLEILQEGLKTGRLREVPDDKFGELTVDDLEPQGEEGLNLFSQVLAVVPPYVRNAHQVYGRKRLSHLVTPEFANVSTTDRDHTVGGVRDSVKDVANMVENEETGFKMSDLVGIRGKSGKFKELMDQVKATAALQDGLFENRQNGGKWRADDAMSIEEAAALPTLSQVDQAFEELDEKADAYLTMKMAERKAASLEELRGKNAYEQKHIDYAKNIRRIVSEYRAKTAAPETEADKKAMMEKTDRTQLDEMRRAKEAAGRIQEAQAKKEQAEKGQDPLLIP